MERTVIDVVGTVDDVIMFNNGNWTMDSRKPGREAQVLFLIRTDKHQTIQLNMNATSAARLGIFFDGEDSLNAPTCRVK